MKTLAFVRFCLQLRNDIFAIDGQTIKTMKQQTQYQVEPDRQSIEVYQVEHVNHACEICRPKGNRLRLLLHPTNRRTNQVGYNCLFVNSHKRVRLDVYGLIATHVNDFLWAGNASFKCEVIDKLNKVFDVRSSQ